MKHESNMVEGDGSLIEYIKFIIVLVIISAVSFILASSTDWMELMRWFMGVFFVVFAAFKFAGYKMFASMFKEYDLIAKRFPIYAYAYPFIEAVLGVAYIMNLYPTPRNLLTFTVMSIGTVGVFIEIKHRRSGVHCACLGNIIKLPLSTVSLIENFTMATMALVMLYYR